MTLKRIFFYLVYRIINSPDILQGMVVPYEIQKDMRKEGKHEFSFLPRSKTVK